MDDVLDLKKLSYANKLRIQLSCVLPGLSSSVYQFYESADIKINYPKYLLLLHQIIRSSVPLMELALEKVITTNSINRKLVVNYLEEHITEEKDHDLWLLDDLKSLGIESKSVVNSSPLISIRELVGSQYYILNHFNPICFLGYIAVLEAFPIPEKRIQTLKIRTGFTDKSFYTLEKHSFLDKFHSDAFFAFLDTLDLSAVDKQEITSNALYTVTKCKEIFDKLIFDKQ